LSRWASASRSSAPGFVRTQIDQSGRNRPERYGPPPSLDPESRAAALVKLIGEQVQAGLDPSVVAARVLQAIEDNALYVFTHPETLPQLERRFGAILTAMEKASYFGSAPSIPST
jgi:hypothetical protein